MSVVKWGLLYFSAGLFFFILDFFWLAILAAPMYQSYLGVLLAEKPVIVGAVLFYLMYLSGILYFGVRPAIEKSSLSLSLLHGSLFGFYCYATYELTNWALIKNWPVGLLVPDILWGTFLTGTTSGLTYFIYHRWLKTKF